MCFAPQRRALFRHLNFQKWSDNGVFCAFWLPNVLRATTACNFSSLLWPDGFAPAALASLLFDPPEPQIIGKTVNRDFPTFSLLLFSLLIFLFSLPLPCSAFHLSILSEVWLLNFLRLLLIVIIIIIITIIVIIIIILKDTRARTHAHMRPYHFYLYLHHLFHWAFSRSLQRLISKTFCRKMLTPWNLLTFHVPLFRSPLSSTAHTNSGLDMPYVILNLTTPSSKCPKWKFPTMGVPIFLSISVRFSTTIQIHPDPGGGSAFQ